MKNKKTRWGILACGKIAAKFCSDVQLVKTAEIIAVASRDLNRANEFANTYGANITFNSYEELAKSDIVDIIYIASPHHLHFEHTMLCLEHGKSVLCEKPIAVNAKQTKQMFAKAKENNCYLMEAMWTKFLPHYKAAKQWSVGNIGEIQLIKADFGFKAEMNLESRLFNPELAGGALLDIGIYPVMAILDYLGNPKDINVEMKLSEQEIDLETKIEFIFPKQKAFAHCTFLEHTPTSCEITGDNGSILIHSRFHENSRTTLYDKHNNILDEAQSEDGYGYHFMIRQVCEDLIQGKLESDIHNKKDTLQLISMLDKIRSKKKFKYPFER